MAGTELDLNPANNTAIETTIVAAPPPVADFTVDSTADAVDASPGDGVCDDGTGSCSLRAAIMEANAAPGADELVLPAGTYMLAIIGLDEDDAMTGDLDVRGDLIIDGQNNTSTIIDGVQLDRFVQVCEGARQRGIDVGLRHAASSAGVISFPEAYLDMVRPGIAIYGQYPSVREYKARRIDLRPAMSLKTRVTYVKTLRPGDAVSYHRAFVAEQDTDVATISMGYSDGYPYQAAGKAEVIVQGRRWPAIALVTSNHMTLDVTGASSLEIGQEAVLFGKQGEVEISAEEVAAWAGTSVYKILIGMNPLLPKTYLGA
ncbi:MAG: alanine racemase [Bacteroidetes bacterium]|nr:alanine racemase [Bacteroidota bacterium]